MSRRNTGILGEKLARDFLERQGYRILETNYRCRRGEIDIVARHRDFLVFVEVRSKKSLEFGTPEESITLAKKRRLKAAALHYQMTHEKLPSQWRIDVVVMELDQTGKLVRAELIENAVGDE